MPNISVFINTSPLLYLHQVGQLEILPKLYDLVITPKAVEEELGVGRERGVDVPDLNSLTWLDIRTVNSASAIPNIIDLGRGEAEVIALGLESSGSLLILDDQLGRRIAKLYQLKYTGTLGVLIKAKQEGYLAAVAPVIKKLQGQGMWLTESVIYTALQLAKETR